MKKEMVGVYHSQSSLRTFQRDPQLYKEIYIDNKSHGIAIKNHEVNNKSIENGVNFHILADRYFNGMKDYFYIKDEKLLKWMKILEENYPLESYKDRDIEIKSEYEIKQDKENLKLLAKYDLLIIDKKKKEITIVDFKTNEREYEGKRLEEDMQTMVYMYLLGENLENMNLNFELGEIKMEYFQLNYPKKRIILKYNDEKHGNYKKKLGEVIKSIKKIK